MEFYCHCPEPMCFCREEIFMPIEEQNEIILARIFAEVMDYEIVSAKICGLCSDGWHVTDFDTGERTKKEETDETDQGSEEPAEQNLDGD